MVRKKKETEFPYQWNCRIGQRHIGKMEPKLTRWTAENKELVEWLKESLESHDDEKIMKMNLSINGTVTRFDRYGSIKG